jgi:hypothetical protein
MNNKFRVWDIEKKEYVVSPQIYTWQHPPTSGAIE